MVALETDAGPVALQITQDHLPHTPWADPALARMPGMRPVEGSWIVVDEAYAAQMAERARLMRDRRGAVEAILPAAEAALDELKALALDALPDGFGRESGAIRTPDGRRVDPSGAPFDVLGALLQEDLLILERRGDEHVLTAGLLCFPAHWTLAEKIGRPLRRIHRPVPEYDDGIALRVQRLFDRVPPGRAMWRANVLAHSEAVLHRPKPEDTPREGRETARFVRSERQTVLRLPSSGAVLFAIHTWIVPLEKLTPDQRVGCPLL
ncbi:heme-dependent oxidative N-demethylase family protein [Jannaschia ovalis]|uniref:DUF3445 domain-containing protein n=1 Tax=Jannaschia ovalis TaxID=3038773 RepID=A0ABY8LCB2_9RHOB|nr:DUF3445 domain-containing protein [Jannaschia sp. GRR-S6-38]WGH78969.1 DUF3445 domain-containing protein [Jannaschia sp. GRR-S6-38]